MKKDYLKTIVLFLMSFILSCILGAIYRVSIWELLDFVTIGITFTAVFAICSDIVDKIFDYPELICWKYCLGVAIQSATTGMFWYASLATEIPWMVCRLILTVCGIVGIYVYDLKVFNIVILDSSNRRKELEDMRFQRLLAKASKLSKEALVDLVKKQSRFMFVGDLFEAGYDYNRRLGDEDVPTFNEMKAEGGHEQTLDVLDQYINAVITAYISKRDTNAIKEEK